MRLLWASLANAASPQVSSKWVRCKRCSSSVEVAGISSIYSFNDGISHSMGRIASRPYTNKKGLNPIALLIEA